MRIGSENASLVERQNVESRDLNGRDRVGANSVGSGFEIILTDSPSKTVNIRLFSAESKYDTRIALPHFTLRFIT